MYKVLCASSVNITIHSFIHTDGTDYVSLTEDVDFDPGDSENCRNITILSDGSILDGKKYFEVMINTSEPNIVTGPFDTARVIILDADCECATV